MVTVAHTTNLTHGLPTFVEGAFGVDLFFVISGFVMMYSTDRLFGRADGPLTFIKRRLIRIVPLYWLVTTLTLLSWWILAWLFKVSWPEYTATNIVGSYLFIPTSRPNNDTGPVVWQGWSLNYEMFFYVIFALFVFLPRKFAGPGVLAALLGLYAFGAPQPFGYFATHLLWLFMTGIVIGLLYRKIGLSRTMGLVCLLAGFAIFAFVSDRFREAGYWQYASIAAGLIVLGALHLEPVKPGKFWSWIVLLGDASYALYLFHGLTMQQFHYTLRWFRDSLDAFQWLYMIVLVASSTAFAILVYLYVERPTTEWLQRLTTRRATPATAWSVARTNNPHQSTRIAAASPPGRFRSRVRNKG